MHIYNIEEHRHCLYYGAGKNALIEIREISPGTEEQITLSFHEMVFMIKGEMRYAISELDTVVLTGGHFSFIPIGTTVKYQITTDCVICIIRQSDRFQLCHGFSLEKLYRSMDKNKVLLQQSEPLETNPRIIQYLNGLKETCSDGIMCRYFFEAKVKELFVLLRAYYSDIQINNLFLPILSPDVRFSEFVQRNFHKYESVREMAEAMTLTYKQFFCRFQKIFATTPQEWMQQKKAQIILNEICSSSKSFKQISFDNGFSAQPHLTRFCQRMFNKTPEEIRKKTDSAT